MSKGFAFDERHDVEQQSFRFAGVEQRQQVGMLQAGGDANLAEESLGAEDGAELGIEDLERDAPVVLDVARQVDGGHAAAPDLAIEDVRGAE